MASNEIVIIPLHQPISHPCNYIEKTAKIISKKNQVIFFDYHFPYSWKNLFKKESFKKLISSFSDILSSEKIIYFRAPSILPLSRLNVIIDLNKKLGFWILSIFLWIFKKNVIVWQFYALISKKIFKKQFFIYDCIDYMNLDDETKKFFYEEKKLFETSDLVSFNSVGLLKKKVETNPVMAKKSIAVVCGCDNKLFDTKDLSKKPIQISQKTILFVGIFDYRTDMDLLHYIVKNNHDLKFIFIGPISENIKKEFYHVTKEKNVRYIGEKTKNELASYLKSANLGIIPYNSKSEFVKYSNPMKAYEYLSSGIPVVSTNILALKDYPKDIVYTTDDKKDFSRAIKRLLNNWNDKKTKSAKNIAEKNSWENKVKLMRKIINKSFS